MPKRHCLEPGCPEFVEGARSKGRCDEHRKKRERERSARRRAETGDPYKKKKWLITRRMILRRDPLCQDGRVCEGKSLSTEVDHIVPLAQGGDPFNPEGLRGTCSPCHYAKSAEERRGQ